MDGDYIKIVYPRKGYLGYNEKSGLAEFVEDKSQEKVGTMWLQFEWQESSFVSAESVMETPGSPVEYEPNTWSDHFLQPSTSGNDIGNGSANNKNKTNSK